MLLNGGELNGKRILSRKTVELMTMNHLPNNNTLLDMNAGGGFSEVRYQGMGYGLSMAVTVDQAAHKSLELRAHITGAVWQVLFSG